MVGNVGEMGGDVEDTELVVLLGRLIRPPKEPRTLLVGKEERGGGGGGGGVEGGRLGGGLKGGRAVGRGVGRRGRGFKRRGGRNGIVLYSECQMLTYFSS